jgi:hypothetical protein
MIQPLNCIRGYVLSFNKETSLAKLFLLAALLFASNQALDMGLMLAGGQSHETMRPWDRAWYAGIVTNGYDLEGHAHDKEDAANWAFFPAHPFIARAVHLVSGMSPEMSLIAVSKITFALSILAFMCFARAYNEKIHPVLAGCVVAFNPYAIYANAGYTEPLFLLGTCLFFLLLKNDKLILAGLAGGFLTSVRLVGIVALASYALRTARLFPAAPPDQKQRMILGFLLIPLGLSLFLLLLYHTTGDALAFMHVQRAWHRAAMHNPLGTIFTGLHKGYPDIYWAIISIIAFIPVLTFSYRKQWELASYSLFCTAIPLTLGLMSMPRFVFWQASFLLFLAEALSFGKLFRVLIPCMLAAIVYTYMVWFSGSWHII